MLTVPFASWITVIIPFQDENVCKLIVKQYTSFGYDYVKTGYNCYVLLIVTFFQKLSVYTLRTVVSVLYVIICCSLRNTLNANTELGAKVVANPNAKVDYAIYKANVQTHECVVSVLKSFEKTMSFPIFLITSSDLMAVMYGVVKLDPLNNLSGYNTRAFKYTSAIIFISLRGILSFLCINLAASDVHEASKNAKDVQKDMLKRILISGEKSDIQELVPFSVLHNYPPFVLTAWGVFRFTKGLFLSAFGSVLTYSLLIMQILK
ncbi:uncharacterized protein NPIL_426611 [Nephila pilipes]|uniref:Gustatory receptor n=1 Tax=Nephila pilipes TaxID=299642 RepID=A0A8X6TIN0_NEPPI|nr:uncharacterized protein NPIL_426611 [Nephila pilipes]